MISTLVPLIIFAIYVPILFVIYLTQLIIVIANKRKSQFRSSYFSLFIVEAIVCLSTVLCNTIENRLVLFPQVNSFYANIHPSAFTTGFYFACYYFPACEEYTHVFIALNRLSVLALNERYERLWSYFFWFAVAVILTFPFISYYHLLDVSAAFIPYKLESGTTYFMDYDHSVRPWRSNRVQSFYLYFCCTVTTFVLNLLVVIVVLRSKTSVKVSTIEVRLFFLGVFTFAAGLPMAIQQFIYMFTSADMDMTALAWRLPWLFDLKSLSPCILSLVFSTAIRNEFRKLLCMRREKSDGTTLVLSTT